MMALVFWGRGLSWAVEEGAADINAVHVGAWQRLMCIAAIGGAIIVTTVFEFTSKPLGAAL